MQGVLGASATSSGVVLIPLSLGWVLASFVSGQLISRTGRYRVVPADRRRARARRLPCCWRCSTRTPRGSSVTLDLVVVGVGMGTMFQTFVIATQNRVDVRDLGVATAAIQFFRSMGGSLAVAGLGALLTRAAGIDEPADRRARRASLAARTPSSSRSSRSPR